ncbi:MAG: Asp-tRNA(Asn)/Glu-tRNA(Gln) amidotransferase subunit GatA [Clostridiales bacterium]|nr:Asp-tRNA(Asn)/Glu-tRNA(Gln) amidotransferase subunit GatA [Clostridiales bacterium]
MNILDLSLREYVNAVRAEEFPVREAIAAYLDRIEQTKELNNFITVCSGIADMLAKDRDGLIKHEKWLAPKVPLLGVPIAVKDNIEIAHERCTCASRALENYESNNFARVIERLLYSGAVIVGKTNMDELAMGSSTENSAFGAARNFHDSTRSAGGSSGGSANCVAAKQALAALGSDTGGSVRQPAAFCGVVGLKPTYSSISRDGLLALVPSLDQIGIFARDCDDAYILFYALCERYEMNAEIAEGELNCDMRGRKIGVIKQSLGVAGLDIKVKEQFEKSVAHIEKLGGEIVELNIPSFDAALDVYHIISSAEAVNSIRHKTGVPDIDLTLVGGEVRRRLVTGAYVLGGDNYKRLYIKAAKVRAVIKREYTVALENVGAIITPTSPTVATKLGAARDPHAEHACDKFAAAASLAGLPAVSVPFGTAYGLPVGVQVIGRANDERGILEVGKALMNG